MQHFGNRCAGASRRQRVRHLEVRRSAAADPKLLDAVWEALNVARENKALLLVRQGTLLNLNALAARLCGLSFHEVSGRCIADLLEDVPPAEIEPWQTE